MAASQAMLELRNNTDANFRLWGSFISNGLAAGGWTKMDSDINWTTVTAPALNTYAGYEIWKSPDEVGLTNFYLKLRYGSANNAAPASVLEYSISFSYAGSGSSLSGTVSTPLGYSTSSAASSTPQLCSIAAGVGYAVINLGNGASVAGQHALAISRSRNTSLEKEDKVLHYYTGQDAGNVRYSTLRVLTPTYKYEPTQLTQSATPSHTGGIVSSNQGVTAVQFGRVGLSFMTGFEGPRTSPFEVLLGVEAGKLGSAGQTVQIPVYGVPKTFLIATAVANQPGSWGIGDGAAYNSLFLYE